VSGPVRIGRVGRPHGVRGTVTVVLDNPGSTLLARLPRIGIDRGGGDRDVLEITRADPRDERRWLVDLAGVGSRDAAEALVGAAVLADREAIDLDEDELLVSDLPGRRIVEDGRERGRVISVYSNGAHDVAVVRTARGLVDFPVVPGRVIDVGDEGRVEVSGFDDFEDLAYADGTAETP